MLPLLEANAWTDMKRKLQQLQLPTAEEASLEAHLAERFATPQRRRRLAERKPFEAHLHVPLPCHQALERRQQRQQRGQT